MNRVLKQNSKPTMTVASVATAVVLLIFYWTIHDLNLFVGDDHIVMAHNIARSFSDVLRDMAASFPVLARGRILGNPLAILLNYFQCAPQSVFIYRLWDFAGILFAVWALFRLLRRAFNRKVALSWALLFGLLAEIYRSDINGLVSFGVLYQLSIGIGLLSLDFLMQYFDSGRKRCLWLCGFFYFFACSCYESFIVFCVPMLVIACWKLKDRKDLTFRSLVRALAIPAVFGAGFLVLFLIGNRSDPQMVYSGAQIDASLSLGAILYTLILSTFSSTPLFLTFAGGGEAFFAVLDGLFAFSLENLLFWLVAFFAAIALVRLLYTIPPISGRTCLATAGTAVSTALLICLPLCLTRHYVTWATENGLVSTGVSYYSYFFLILALLMGLLWLVQKTLRFKRAVRIVLVVLFAFSGYLSFSSNSYYKRVVNHNSETFEEFLSCGYFQERLEEDNWFILRNGEGLYTSESYVQGLLRDAADSDFELLYEDPEICPQGNVLFVKKYWMANALVFYQPDADYRSGEVMLLFSDYNPDFKLTVYYSPTGDPNQMEDVHFPLDGQVYAGMESIDIIPLDSGSTMVVLRTLDPWDFRYTRQI